jgi:virginiamycin B lyase
MTHLLRRDLLQAGALLPLAGVLPAPARAAKLQGWKLATNRRTGIHDVAPAPDGGVWFSAQASGHLGWFDPKTGRTDLIPLGGGSSPHGVIQGPDKAAWLTDGGQNAIVRVGWPDRLVKVFALPPSTGYTNLNTCAFDGDGDLWFTGQGGYIGKVAVKTGEVTVKNAPRGRGAYGICSTPSGDVWYCSLAQSYIARIDRKTGESHVVEPPTKDQGARRVWSDSQGRIWVSEWNSGQLSMHDPRTRTWKAWKPPGEKQTRIYAVYVDEREIVWISEWGNNAMFSFDPKTETFERIAMERESTNIRQILGRKGEVWLPESGTEHISVIRTA